MIRRIALLCLALCLPAFAQTTLNGAGATFPYPMYSKWFSKYHDAHPDIQFNYQSIGSGGGIRQVLAGTVDFGASDGPMTDEQLAQAKIKILHVPTVLGAVVPAYNVSGINAELKSAPRKERLRRGESPPLHSPRTQILSQNCGGDPAPKSMLNSGVARGIEILLDRRIEEQVSREVPRQQRGASPRPSDGKLHAGREVTRIQITIRKRPRLMNCIGID